MGGTGLYQTSADTFTYLGINVEQLIKQVNAGVQKRTHAEIGRKADTLCILFIHWRILLLPGCGCGQSAKPSATKAVEWQHLSSKNKNWMRRNSNADLERHMQELNQQSQICPANGTTG